MIDLNIQRFTTNINFVGVLGISVGKIIRMYCTYTGTPCARTRNNYKTIFPFCQPNDRSNLICFRETCDNYQEVDNKCKPRRVVFQL